VKLTSIQTHQMAFLCMYRRDGSAWRARNARQHGWYGVHWWHRRYRNSAAAAAAACQATCCSRDSQMSRWRTQHCGKEVSSFNEFPSL